MNERQQEVYSDIKELAMADNDANAKIGPTESSEDVVGIIYEDNTATFTPDEATEIAQELALTAKDEGWLDSPPAFIAVYMREDAAFVAGNRSEAYLKDRFGDFDSAEDYDAEMVDFGRLGLLPSEVSTAR